MKPLGPGSAPRAALLALFLASTGGAPASAQSAIDVAAGDLGACALYDDGSVWCWGVDILTGQKSGPLHAIRVEDLPPATSISSGRLGACATDGAGTLRCWGFDCQRTMKSDAAVISQRPFVIENLPPVVESSVGYIHQCARTADGEVWCWGGNPLGELGCGDTSDRADPVRVEDLGRAVSVSAGTNNTCAATASGRVACWGSDNPSGAGDGVFVFEGMTPQPIPRVGGIASVANGRNFACGLGSDGRVICWGSNIMRQLGSESPEIGEPWRGIGGVKGIGKATDLDASYFHACAVTSGEVWCWGNETYKDGPTSMGDLARRLPGTSEATRVGTGPGFTCAVAAGDVLCWGARDHKGEAIIPGMTPDDPVPVPGLPR